MKGVVCTVYSRACSNQEKTIVNWIAPLKKKQSKSVAMETTTGTGCGLHGTVFVSFQIVICF